MVKVGNPAATTNNSSYNQIPFCSGRACSDLIYQGEAILFNLIMLLVIPNQAKNPIKIYNDMGECVLSDVAQLKRIDISQLPKGIYFIKIGDKFAKFVKE